MKQSPRLERYTDLVGQELLQKIYAVSGALSGCHVLHINTTEHGGGVAEILQEIIPIMEELGIPHIRKIVPLDEASNRFTAHLVDLLQGMARGEIAEEDKRTFLEKLRLTPELIHPEAHRADVYFVHDFQLAPLATLYPWMRPALWMSHVDTAHPDAHAEAYIEQFLDDYQICVFNSHASIFAHLPQSKTCVITPTIDPFSEKNRFLPQDQGIKLLAACNIDTSRPLITQVSRFGNWKNPWQVIDIYRQVKAQLPSVQMAYVGAMEASDDIQAIEILKDVQKYAGSDPNIHLLSDPHVIGPAQVNAFQRYSSVILQRSTREGFGLTVTEGMWKYQPVVGTNVTGLREQIIHGQNGYLVDDTEGSARVTLELILDRDLWRRIGEQAHLRVKNNYLLPIMVLEYLGALRKAIGR